MRIIEDVDLFERCGIKLDLDFWIFDGGGLAEQGLSAY